MRKDAEGIEYHDDDHGPGYMFDEADGSDWEGFTEYDCGLMPDGQCALAGTEDCDWECPNSHGPRYCGSNAWHLAHQNLPVEGCECPECRKTTEKD